MSSSFTKYWKKRSALNVGHRGAGSTHAAKWVITTVFDWDRVVCFANRIWNLKKYKWIAQQFVCQYHTPTSTPFKQNCFFICILQAPQSQGEHNSLIQKCCQTCKLLRLFFSWVNITLKCDFCLICVLFVYMQGAAYVEFDVHLSKDAVPIVYHDLTCCISTKKVNLRPVVLDARHIEVTPRKVVNINKCASQHLM